MIKLEKVQPFGHSKASKIKKKCHILLIFPVLGNLTHMRSWCCPKFTFSTFTPDPNLHTPHIYTRPKFTQTQIYTRPKFTQTQIYTNPFLDIYFNKPKFTQPKFTQNPNLHNPNLRNPNLHKTQIYTTQIYTKLKKNTILLSKFTQN